MIVPTSADVSGIPYFCFFKKDEKVFIIITCISRWSRSSMNAQVTNNVNMENKNQLFVLSILNGKGGIVDHWMPDIPAEDSSRGYYLGPQLLNYLAPQTGQNTVEVPVSLDIK